MRDRLNRRQYIGALTTAGLASLTAGCLSTRIADTTISDPVRAIEVENTSGPIRISADYGNRTLGQQLVTAVVDTSKQELIFPPLTEENPVQDSMSALSPPSGSQAVVASDSDISLTQPDPIQFTATEESTYCIILSPFSSGISRDDIDTAAVDVGVETVRTGVLSDDEEVVSVNSDPTPLDDFRSIVEDLLITDRGSGRYEGFVEYFSPNAVSDMDNDRARQHYFGAFLVFAEAYRRLNRADDRIDPLWNRLIAADIRATTLGKLNKRAEQLLDFCILVIRLKYDPPQEVLTAIEETIRERMSQIASFQLPIDRVQFNPDGTALAPTRISIEASVSSPVPTKLDRLELSIRTPRFQLPLNYGEFRWELRDLGEIAQQEARELIDEIDAFIDGQYG